MISKHYPLLNDKNWLDEQYNNKRQSVNQIAIYLACNSNSVRQALLGHKFTLRNSSIAQTFNNPPIILQSNIINGCLLGDGSLVCSNSRSSITCAHFSKGNKFKDHVEYISKQFYPNTFLQYITYSPSKLKGKIYDSYRFRTLTYPELNPFYQSWYPKSNNYKKIVPKSLALTPEIVHHWFLDDGCASYNKKKHKWFVNIIFSSESFTKEENEFLAQQLNNLADLDARVATTNSGSGYRIRINASHTHKFYNLIGPSTIPSLSYKWKDHLSDRIDTRDMLQYKLVNILC